MLYKEDDLLMLSGIQHFYFCKRQWALIHIEQLWQENRATAEGKIVHENADNPFFYESRRNIFASRSVPLISYRLGLYGIADVIEFVRNVKGASIDNREGKWLPNIIEYKRGGPKPDERDEVQLTAQAMALEEMLNYEIRIEEAYFYYYKIRRRVKIIINEQLRNLVEKASKEMHEIFSKRFTPDAIKGKNCSKCSMYSLCMPRLTKKKQNIENYINKHIVGDE
ncbi:MAG: CRISPR-associated protein Cas4 [Bacilli bacterium]|jgi:CRISPR-associated exonuclease Cas4